jgi:leader peptidase (prepilin peptidase) / N-methyltransferase
VGEWVRVTAVVVVICAALGLVVGSFVNVVAHRVPRGESVVRPRSACPACGHEIRSRDNVPVVSWLLLRGACRDCGARISARYPAVELLTAVVFGLLAWRLGLDAALPAFLYLGGLGVALAVIDLDVKRLPNALTLPSYVVVPALLGLAAVADGDPGAWVRAMAAGAALYAFYFVLAFVYPAGMGFGDVKLAGILGMYLGWLGWDVWLVGAFLGFLLGGLTGVALMVTHRAGRKSEIPFGPFMLAGVLLAVLVGEPLVQAYVDTLV